MKDQHRRPAFVQRFGRGPTELDALEALHPGKLEELVEEWIARYHDHSLNDRIDEVVEQVKTDLTPIHDQVRERHADAIASVKSQLRQAKKQIKATIKAFEKNARPILRAIEQDLNAAAPDVDSYDWPEPEENDAIVDPLFDSQRDYLDQIDRYKEHQRKPTEGKGHSAPRTGKMHMVKCLNCPNEFEARRSDTQFCSGKCRSEYQRKRDRGEAPPSTFKKKKRETTFTCEFCNEDFQSVGFDVVRSCGKPECERDRKAAEARERRSLMKENT